MRSRKEDIPQLCIRFIEKINQEYGKNVEGLTEKALALLTDYHWPGNVRELENVLSRAVIFMKNHDKLIDEKRIVGISTGDAFSEKTSVSLNDPNVSLAQRVEEFEKKVIEETLEKHDGNKTMTAKVLGLSVRNLYYKLEKYNFANSNTQ